MDDRATMAIRAVIRLHFFWLIGICGTALTGYRSNGAEQQPTSEATTQCELTEADARELAKAFEAGFQESMLEADRRDRLHDQQRQHRLVGMESVSIRQFDAGWKIDVDIDRQPARAVLAGLLSELGLQLPKDSEFADALEQPVRLKLRGGSRLQAIEAICSQIGLYPDYAAVNDAPGGWFAGMMRMMQAAAGPYAMPAEPKPAVSAAPAVNLRRGKRPFPIAFAGPYAVHISRLNEFPPHAFGKVELSVLGAGVPASVSAYWEHENWSGLSNLRVQDAHGVDLVVHDTCLIPWSWDTGDPSCLRRGRAQYELMNLLRPVRSIRLDCRVSATVPAVVETVRLDDLAPGAVKEGKEIRVRVIRLQSLAKQSPRHEVVAPQKCSSLQLAIGGRWEIPVEIIALDDAGNAIKIDGSSLSGCSYRQSGPGGSVTGPPPERFGMYHLDGDPKSLVVKAFVTLERVEFPVELVADLGSSEKQPVKPVELRSPGAAPLTIEVLNISDDAPFHEAHLRMTNCSNKDIRYVLCTLNYVQPAGQVVKGDLPPLSPRPGLDSDVLPLLVPKNSTIEMKTTAFEAPNDAISATATLKSVHFADGTAWKPPKK